MNHGKRRGGKEIGLQGRLGIGLDLARLLLGDPREAPSPLSLQIGGSRDGKTRLAKLDGHGPSFGAYVKRARIGWKIGQGHGRPPVDHKRWRIYVLFVAIGPLR